MSKPVVAIVGRPNVGKSTFFNYIIGQKLSIVEDKPGVTRDRVYADTEWRGRKFTLIDTAGIEQKSTDEIITSMREQVQIAIDLADVILFLTDIKQGITEQDKDIALILKKAKKQVILVCNKADRFNNENSEIYEFYNLGLGEPYPVSSVNAIGIGDILDEIYNHFPEEKESETDEDVIKVALIRQTKCWKIIAGKQNSSVKTE